VPAGKVPERPARDPKELHCTLSDREWMAPPYVPKERLLPGPRVGRSVWPGQCCPRFRPRRSGAGLAWAECWFCRYADFHLDQEAALDVGICCYPGSGTARVPEEFNREEREH